jgi:hypothetical protein
MSHIVSLAVLIVGIVLLVFAASAADSISSFFSNMFSGTPDARTMALLLGGIFLVVVGGFGILRRSRSV